MSCNTSSKSREISLKRAEELHSRIEDYLKVKDHIPKGASEKQLKTSLEKKEKMLKMFNATEEDWKSWQWQLKSRISDVDVLKEIIRLSEKEIEDIRKVGEKFRWSVSPYYASLIDDDNKYCPVKLMSIPSGVEIEDLEGDSDPMGEEFTNCRVHYKTLPRSLDY